MSVQRIVIVADTHGWLDPRVAEIAAGANLVIHAGDVGAGVDDALRTCCPDVRLVQGNNDPADAPWPERLEYEAPGGRLAVTHGHQWPARIRHRRLRATFPEARAVICGHSHRRVLETETVPWILNPGAAGRARAYGGPGCLTLFADTDAWRLERHAFTPRRTRRSRRRSA